MHSNRFPAHKHLPSLRSPAAEPAKPTEPSDVERYSVRVNGKAYSVEVSEGGELGDITAVLPEMAASATMPTGEPIAAPLAGNIFKLLVSPGQQVREGDVIVVMEAMKMETEIRSTRAGIVDVISIKEGDAVVVGQTLISLN